MPQRKVTSHTWAKRQKSEMPDCGIATGSISCAIASLTFVRRVRCPIVGLQPFNNLRAGDISISQKSEMPDCGIATNESAITPLPMRKSEEQEARVRACNRLCSIAYTAQANVRRAISPSAGLQQDLFTLLITLLSTVRRAISPSAGLQPDEKDREALYMTVRRAISPSAGLQQHYPEISIRMLYGQKSDKPKCGIATI